MKQDDMEKRFQTAVEHAAPDVLDQVMDGCTQLPDTAAIIPLPRSRRRLAAGDSEHRRGGAAGGRIGFRLQPLYGV